MAPTTVRLYPLWYEHALPMLVDVACFAVLAPLMVVFGSWWIAVTILVVLAVHVAQLAWLVAVRFDDDAITVIRPWRRRRVPWDRVAGLVYSQEPTSQQGRDPYRLRLVLTDHEPPAGRYLPDAELAPYVKGPVIMTLYGITRGPGDSRADRCQEQVYALLERHGVTRPEPYALRFHSVKYTVEEETLAIAADLLRASQGIRAVTVNHPGPHDAGQTELIDRTLPELAIAHGADPPDRRSDRYSVFFFASEDAEQAAAGFLAAARAVVPGRWHVTPTALPEPLGFSASRTRRRDAAG
ncbi:hypothetical protein [Actinomadura sp. DC4]|uniref:hypothetical protein n=1 Tax=Actinomadura sp. DC4 TaxID=3055069 RepID=UPI0025B21185|nr:hypothetical protein [Actinomadura sp. DC4]MDN3352424.1 hypothetical protein [Actinomadura sp. DC4]